MYVGMCVLSLSLPHTHTQKMRGSAKKGICVNLTDDGKENPATEVL
jgi:hypothetical protein